MGDAMNDLQAAVFAVLENAEPVGAVTPDNEDYVISPSVLAELQEAFDRVQQSGGKA
jgi:hypothetical protein